MRTRSLDLTPRYPTAAAAPPDLSQCRMLTHRWSHHRVKHTPLRLHRSDLRSTGLSGTLPATLGNLSALQYLCASPLAHSLSLVEPACQVWQVECAAPQLQQWPTLLRYLGGNANLARTLPSSFSGLTNLVTLCAPSRQLTARCAPTSKNTCRSYFLSDRIHCRDLEGSSLSGSLPTSLGTLVSRYGGGAAIPTFPGSHTNPTVCTWSGVYCTGGSPRCSSWRTRPRFRNRRAAALLFPELLSAHSSCWSSSLLAIW